MMNTNGNNKIKLTSSIKNDDYTSFIYQAFDIQNREETTTDLDYDFSMLNTMDWNVGVIFGGSGSGKTTILKDLGELTRSSFDNKKALISNFDWLEPKEAARLLASIGLSSVPAWLRPFNLLSNGEQYRAELAYKVGKARDNEIILIDEYTSVVDRDVAKAMSFALQKYIRRTGKKIILASCHYDIMEWLMPDWTYSPKQGGALERGEWLRQGRPEIKLQVSRVESGTWDLFKKHHYLSDKCVKSFQYLLFTLNENPVALCAYAPMPSGSVKNACRLARTVVLPDFQGVGIGSAVSNFTAAILKSTGKNVFTKTVNPALGEYRNSMNFWRGTRRNGKPAKTHYDNHGISGWKTLARESFCHEYMGNVTTGYEHILKPIEEMRKEFQFALDLV